MMAIGKMKAIVQEAYGPASTLRIVDLPVPKVENLGAGQVLIKVEATSLNAPDWRLLRGKPWIMRLFTGLTKPSRPIRGTDLAGTVVGVGASVSHLKAGDQVYADLADSGFGAWAEYAVAKAEVVAVMPSNLSFLEAAALPITSVTALQAVRDAGQVGPGQRVLIVGASGGVGSYAIQHAKILGAHVTAVVSGKNVAQSQSLGADAVIDYTQVSLEKCGETFDVILAINGFNPLSVYRGLMAPQGRLVMVGGKSIQQIMSIAAFGGLMSKKGGQSFIGFMAHPSARDLGRVKELVEAGLLRPVIDREVPFAGIPESLAELEKGHTGGKIVARVG